MATAQQQPPSSTREEALIAAIAAILLAGLAIAATRNAIRLALAPLRLNLKAIDAAVDLARRVPRVYIPPRRPRAPTPPHGRILPVPGGGTVEMPVPRAPQTVNAAMVATRDGLMDYRAAYLLNAAQRIDQTIAERPETETADAALKRALGKERRWFRAHRRMQDKRLAAARAVDIAASIHGPRLGWWATNPDPGEACYLAHGKDFYADRPPIVGGHRALPGSVHPSCQCRAGPAFNTTLLPA